MKNAIFYLMIAILLPFSGSLFSAERMVDEVSGIEFVLVPGGCFAMGVDQAAEPQPGWSIPMPAVDEVPRHEVCVDSFWLGQSEVTRAQWMKVTGQVLYGSVNPANNVSWDEAVSFTEQLSAKSKGRFRLPTEAEWEYACNAGVYRPARMFSDEDHLDILEETRKVAWYRYRAGRDPSVYTVKSKQPNAWGLYDMLGNVWEWTQDGYDETAYARHAKHNPAQEIKDERRVIRGGSYKSDIAQVRCGARSFAPAFDRSPVFGFRVMREVDPPQKIRGASHE